jgi:hypothetical protein
MSSHVARRVIAILDPDNLDYLIRATEIDEASGFDPVRVYGRTFSLIVNEALREYRERRAFRAAGRQRAGKAA